MSRCCLIKLVKGKLIQPIELKGKGNQNPTTSRAARIISTRRHPVTRSTLGSCILHTLPLGLFGVLEQGRGVEFLFTNYPGCPKSR